MTCLPSHLATWCERFPSQTTGHGLWPTLQPSLTPIATLTLTLTLLLQGWGNFINVGVLLILLCICDVQSSSKQNSHPNRLGTVWRLAFGLGIIPVVFIILYRIIVLKVCVGDLLQNIDNARQSLGHQPGSVPDQSIYLDHLRAGSYLRLLGTSI